jgi:hypothetical protein
MERGRDTRFIEIIKNRQNLTKESLEIKPENPNRVGSNHVKTELTIIDRIG